MGNELKQIRGQIRQITKELLPEMISNELVDNVYKELSKVIVARLTNLEGMVKEKLEGIEARSKEIQEFILRKSMENIDVSKLNVEDKA